MSKEIKTVKDALNRLIEDRDAFSDLAYDLVIATKDKEVLKLAWKNVAEKDNPYPTKSYIGIERCRLLRNNNHNIFNQKR